MPRGRPANPMKKRDVQLIVKHELARALSQLSVKALLIGTRPKGRPFGSRAKKRK